MENLMQDHDKEDPEDVFGDALVLLGGDCVREETVRYGELILAVAPKEGKANTLLADQLFSPALLLAERIERGLIAVAGRTMVELGAGCALPTLLATTLREPPSGVVVTDYPADILLRTLEGNVRANGHLRREGCRIAVLGHEWGTDTEPVRLALKDGLGMAGFDVVIMSDLLHFGTSHAALATSLVGLLRRHEDARVYVAAGKYTGRATCEAFLRTTRVRGIKWSAEGSEGDDAGGRWLGTTGTSLEGLGGRKGLCWWWVGEWEKGVI